MPPWALTRIWLCVTDKESRGIPVKFNLKNRKASCGELWLVASWAVISAMTLSLLAMWVFLFFRKGRGSGYRDVLTWNSSNLFVYIFLVHSVDQRSDPWSTMYRHATRHFSDRLRIGCRIDGLCSPTSSRVRFRLYIDTKHIIAIAHCYPARHSSNNIRPYFLHSDRGNASAEISTDAMTTVQQHQQEELEKKEAINSSPLGVVPHSIRGFLHRHQQVLPATEAFFNCTACSPLVIQRYAEKGYAFLAEVFNDSDILEQVSGLADLHKDIATIEVNYFIPILKMLQTNLN